MAAFTKDPADVLDYTFDWGTYAWLVTGDTIATSTWSVPAGLTEVTNTKTTTTTTIWLSGGTSGTQYTLRNTITTTGGRTAQRAFSIEVCDL